jgi:hypothetical protein
MNGRATDLSMPMIGAIALGAGLLYFWNPVGGPRRRALAQDKTSSFFHQFGDDSCHFAV